MSRKTFPNGCSCEWVEIYQCPLPELNGELTFSKAIGNLFNIDVVIDVGAANSYLPKYFDKAKRIFLFDKHAMNHRHKNVLNIHQFVGTGEDQLKLKDFHIEDYKHFYKIDTDGYDFDVIKTIDDNHFQDISFLQFEYDFHWQEKNFNIVDCIMYLRKYYKNFFYIQFNKLVRANIYDLSYEPFNKIGYKNIVCTNHSETDINIEMNRLHPDLDNSFYHKLKDVAIKDLEKQNTAKRRGNNYPHWTFKEN